VAGLFTIPWAMRIKVSQLTKKYGEFVAVDNISFEVPHGEILGYLGRNGAGKSTTVKMLTGILLPTSGSILIDGANVVDNAIAVKQKIGYVPESGGLYESLTGYEFLELMGRLYHLSEEVIAHKAREFLRLFQLEDVMHQRLSSYSKGMKQKVLISSALIHNPDLLFFDEPLSGLDANSMLLFKELLRHLADQGKTIFYCSHVLDVVERICKRVIIIEKGRIIADAQVAQLKEVTAQKSLEDVFQKLTDASELSAIAREFSSVVSGKT
jgi:ABC-2 type transport system ATP-binding protein